MSYTSGRIDITATALDAIHHGAGNSGNTALLRTQQAVDFRTGERYEAPFISGNSLKHMLRDGAVRFALDAMGVPDGALSRPVINLLFSGGTLAKGSGSVDLALARQMEALMPALSLCGYAAGNAITGGKLKVDNLHLVCAENAWRAPESVQDLPHIAHPEAVFRGEDFGTRHDATRLPHVSRLLALEGRKQADLALSARQKTKTAAPKEDDSSQMIYSFQTILAGSAMWGAIHLAGVTEGELVALRSGLAYACEGEDDGAYLYRVGGMSSRGWGRIAFRLRGAVRVDAPSFQATDALLPVLSSSQEGDAVAAYANSLRERREEILAFLAEVA